MAVSAGRPPPLRDVNPGRRTITSAALIAALIAALVVGYFAVYLATLDARPLARMDEFRYAEIPREMLARDNWVAPRLNGLRYFEKPVLGYWVGAASFALFGESNFAGRLPFAQQLVENILSAADGACDLAAEPRGPAVALDRDIRD